MESTGGAVKAGIRNGVGSLRAKIIRPSRKLNELEFCAGVGG
jgi:hypothetical protein